jgi:hypothetical protein
MIRLLVRVGIAASFVTFHLTLYLLFEVHNSRSLFEKKINALRSELHATQKNLTRTEQLLNESHSAILRKLPRIESSQPRIESSQPRIESSQPRLTSGPFCKITSTEHILRLTDKDIVSQHVIYLPDFRVKHAYLASNPT